MKIKEYDTNELLMIANNVTGEYSDKQVRQAKEELYRRGVEDKVIADIMEEKEEAFMRRLDAAALAEQARLDKEREEQECQLPVVGTDTDVPVRPILYVL